MLLQGCGWDFGVDEFMMGSVEDERDMYIIASNVCDE